ncbi:MAG: hypothetical protein NUW23_15950, partial [Firmicutes bacterium]|nr:hypothetical protein [Bacillota bacterium]
SWVQFRASLTEWPYEGGWYAYFRFATDFSIVGLYAAQLYSISDIVNGLGLYRYVSSYGVIFSAYIISGLLRRATYGARASRQRLLWGYWLALQALKVLYSFAVRRLGPLVSHVT